MFKIDRKKQDAARQERMSWRNGLATGTAVEDVEKTESATGTPWDRTSGIVGWMENAVCRWGELVNGGERELAKGKAECRRGDLVNGGERELATGKAACRQGILLMAEKASWRREKRYVAVGGHGGDGGELGTKL